MFSLGSYLRGEMSLIFRPESASIWDAATKSEAWVYPYLAGYHSPRLLLLTIPRVSHACHARPWAASKLEQRVHSLTSSASSKSWCCLKGEAGLENHFERTIALCYLYRHPDYHAKSRSCKICNLFTVRIMLGSNSAKT